MGEDDDDDDDEVCGGRIEGGRIEGDERGTEGVEQAAWERGEKKEEERERKREREASDGRRKDIWNLS